MICMNKLMIIGNLTRDPETRVTSTGVSLCQFTVAVNSNRRRSGAQQGDNAQDDTMFVRVTAWRNLGEVCQRYLAKGRKVYAAGPLQARTYTANDGTTRVSLEMNADEIEFLSSGNSAGDGAGAPAPYTPAAAPTAQNNGFEAIPADDDLPF